jgi:hypothetical protein
MRETKRFSGYKFTEKPSLFKIDVATPNTLSAKIPNKPPPFFIIPLRDKYEIL